MVKLIAILKKRSDLTPVQFARHWREVHGPLVAGSVPGLRKYVQNHAVKLPGFSSDIDGIAELWFDDAAALNHYLTKRRDRDASVKPILEDEPNFLEAKRPYFFAEEVNIK